MNAVTWGGPLMMRFGPPELEQTGAMAKTIGGRLALVLPPLLAVLAGAPLWVRHARGWSIELTLLTAAWLVVSTFQDLMNWSATAAQAFRSQAIANLFIKVAPLSVVVVALVHPFPITAEVLIACSLAGVATASVFLL